MRRSFVVGLAVACASAVVACVFAVALPAWHARQNHAFQAAGRTALGRVNLPSAFRPYVDTEHRQTGFAGCHDTVDSRCFVVAGTPREQIANAQTGLTAIATGRTTTVCGREPLAGVPDHCFVYVPVTDGALLVMLYSRMLAYRPLDAGGPVLRGSYVNIVVGGRSAPDGAR